LRIVLSAIFATKVAVQNIITKNVDSAAGKDTLVCIVEMQIKQVLIPSIVQELLDYPSQGSLD
jgi:hypothetical protein